MKAEVPISCGAALPLAWGVANPFPTRSAVRGFGDISEDNRNVITMEWIIEGIALIFPGTLVVIVTVLDPRSPVSTVVFLSSATCLIVLAGVSMFTGFRIHFLPFRPCPITFTSAAVLIRLGVKAP